MVQFWFEFASTYSYLSAMRIEAAAGDVAIEWRPFLLGPIFAESGWSDSPFNLFPAKGRYMWREMERFTATYGLRYRRPSVFPRHTVLAARVACLAVPHAWGPAYVRAVFEANFADDRDIADPAELTALVDSLGQDGAALVAAAATPETKQELRRATDEARALGIFGAPSFIAGGELYFGNDRLEQALDRARAA
jgi:2-hydroxychromene-2-carboxylate isomerase